ncbi:MAG: protoporphyrinogen oxidase, partial [Anaerolineales bacterium]
MSLVESEARLGGKIITERVDGFVIEGGPDSFLAVKPRGLGLCRELGLGARLRGTHEQARRTYVMYRGQLRQLPEGLTGLVPSRFGPIVKSNLLSPFGKLRLGMDYLIPPRLASFAARSASDDESLAAFVSRRLGREAYDRLVEPLLGGIYAGDGEQLSLAATFPHLRQAELEHGGLIKGLLAAQKKAGMARPFSAFLAPATGIAEIVEALTAQLSGPAIEIRRETRVTRVIAASSTESYTLVLGNGETLRADAVLFATPAFVTADLVAGFDPPLANVLRSIPYVSVATISVAYPLADIPRPLDGYGYIIPRVEGRAILACTWASTKFPQRAPEGMGLIRVFVGRAGQEAVVKGTDNDLLNLARDELRDTLGITAPPTLHRVFRWPKAIPQYTRGHLDRLAIIDQRCAM